MIPQNGFLYWKIVICYHLKINDILGCLKYLNEIILFLLRKFLPLQTEMMNV